VLVDWVDRRADVLLRGVALRGPVVLLEGWLVPAVVLVGSPASGVLLLVAISYELLP
jgi:hypothetical protein